MKISKQNTKTYLLITVVTCLLLSTLMLTACNTIQGNVIKETKEDSIKDNMKYVVNEPIKIGVTLPLSGEAASFGDNGLAGIKLATQEINSKGGINGRLIELYVEDNLCTPQGGTNSVTKLATTDTVDVILGPVCSSSAAASLPIAKDNNIPVVIMYATSPELTGIGDNIFRICPSDSLQGVYTAQFIHDTQKKKNVAIVYVNNAWGKGLDEVFKKEFTRLGGNIVFEAGVDQKQTDFRTEISKIKESGADVVYIPLYPATGTSFSKQAKELNLNMQLIGGDSLGADEYVQSGYADNTIYIVSKVDTPELFKQRIHSVSGYETLDVNLVATYGYDAMNIAAEAIKSAGTTDHEAVKIALRNTNHVGISNPFIEFDTHRDLKQAVFESRIIKNKESLAYG